MAHQNIIPIPVRGDFLQEAFERIFDAMTKDNPLIYYLNQLTKIMLKSYISKQKKGNRMLYFRLAGGQNAAKIADEMADFADQILLESEEKMDVSKIVNDNMNTCRITLR